MSDIDNVISLSISVQSTTLTRAGFGVPAILDFTTVFTDERVREYTSLSAMVTDGFATTDLAYVAANKIFSQNPRPTKVKVFRRLRAPTQLMELTPTTAVSTTYSFSASITGGTYQQVSYTSSATANAAEIINGLTAAVAALSSYSGNVVASNQTTKLRVVAATAGKYFSLSECSSTFSAVVDDTANVSIATDLSDCEDEDNDYYGLITTSKGQDEIVALAAAVETRRRYMVAGTMDTDTYGTSTLTDTAGLLKASSYKRSSVFVQKNKHMEQGDAAVLGRWLPYQPGSETMNLKDLSGVETDTYTDTQFSNLTLKNALFYKTIANVDVLFWGKSAQGQFMDTTRFIDWLYANIQEDLFVLLSSNSKIPFTDAGIAQVEGIIRSVLAKGISVGGLAEDPAPNVIVPLAADVATADKASRTLTPITFTATLAGAVHTVTITGTVSV